MGREGAYQRDPYAFLPTVSDDDLFLFGKGDHRRLYDKLGAQLLLVDGVAGTSFAVWAPNAQRVSVVGDFNGWDGRVTRCVRWVHPVCGRSLFQV
jgi:1,4-alpha-glucan branching enzyme